MASSRVLNAQTRDWYALENVANTALKAGAWSWFIVAVAGQWIFAFYIAAHYGGTALRGNFQAWNKTLANGWVAGNSIGNAALALHLLFAAIITLSGALQLLPQLRSRFPIFHRWNGRVYVVIAFVMGLSALYLTLSGRKVVGDWTQHLAVQINAVLILFCAAVAWRYALARDFKTHSRWALRLFLVVGGVWFFRVGLMLSFLIFKGPVGFDPDTFTGPLITFLTLAQYLVPLAVLELYLRTKERPGALRRFAMAATLFVLTLATGAGVFAATMGMWVPPIKQSFDSRNSIAETLSGTIASSGVDEAERQYRFIKAAAPATYNLDEEQLNSLGYQLLHAKKFKDAIRIFQLNVEAYPQSANAYDSLAEAYMDDGDKLQAIANYEKTLQLNPKSRNAVKMLQKLNAP